MRFCWLFVILGGGMHLAGCGRSQDPTPDPTSFGSRVAVERLRARCSNEARFSNVMNWLNLGFLGLLASAACFAMWNRACREIGVVHATIGLYLTPIVGVLFAAIFLGERLTMMSLCGGLIIIFGVVIANWRVK